MPKIVFTPNLERHLAVPPAEVPAETLREALSRAFDRNPRLAGYVLDDQGGLRPHIMVFLDGAPIRDRSGLTDAVSEETEIYVMQALSGG